MRTTVSAINLKYTSALFFYDYGCLFRDPVPTGVNTKRGPPKMDPQMDHQMDHKMDPLKSV